MILFIVWLYIFGACSTLMGLVAGFQEIRLGEIIISLGWFIVIPAAVLAALIEITIEALKPKN